MTTSINTSIDTDTVQGVRPVYHQGEVTELTSPSRGVNRVIVTANKIPDMQKSQDQGSTLNNCKLGEIKCLTFLFERFVGPL